MNIIFLPRNIYCLVFTLDFCILGTISVEVLTTTKSVPNNNLNKSETNYMSRRILHGNEVQSGRPYMVYLKQPPNYPKFQEYKSWLCGGVIIHEEYILTSAACIEDVKHFYVISGTFRHADGEDMFDNLCIQHGAKKAVWKCIPRNYIFDGHENDNLRWLNNDIAIVKVDEEFDFHNRIRGCDFIPKPVRYNNQSVRLERPGIVGSIAGWGSLNSYNQWINRRQAVFPKLMQEAQVTIIPKNICKQRWGPRYHNIIDNYMICSRDNVLDLSSICKEKYADCRDINYGGSEENDAPYNRRAIGGDEDSASLEFNDTRRFVKRKPGSGGFCENDHGGPLIYSTGVNSVVIGVISACLVKEQTNKCYGPYLYTSVYKNRRLINCAIYKDRDIQNECNKIFRSGDNYVEEEFSWVGHPDGPSKHDLAKARRMEEKNQRNNTAKNETLPSPQKPFNTTNVQSKKNDFIR